MRGRKIWLVTALVLLVLGLAVFGLALSAVGFDLGKARGEEAVFRTLELKGPVERIVIRTDTERVSFPPAEEGYGRVEYRERERSRFQATEKNGTLTVSSETE